LAAKYDAFISYSHSADGRLAPAVQTGLHKLARPWHRRRALWIFRDETGLAVNPGLWPAIREAMDSSDYFILLASPDAAQSPWVNQEIDHWRMTNRDDRILLVLTDGTWSWDADGGDDGEQTSAVPPALRGAFRDEPRHLDLRWARHEDQLDLRHSQFRAAIADLAAPIHGTSKEDLEGEDIRQFRRFRRIRAAAVAALATLALASSLLGVVAMRNAERAEQEAGAARRAARVALSRQLSADAKNLIRTDLDLALLLGVEAYRQEPTTQAFDALLTVTESQPELETYLYRHQEAVLRLKFVTKRRLLSVDGAGLVMEWDPETRKGKQVADLAIPISAADISDDGSALAFAEVSKGLGRANASRVHVVNLDNGEERVFRGHQVNVESLAFAPDGRSLYSGDADGEIIWWDISSGDKFAFPDIFNGITGISLDPDGWQIAVGDIDGRVAVWNLNNGNFRELGRLPAPVGGLAFNSNGTELAFSDSIGNVKIWHASRRSIESVRLGDPSLLSETSDFQSVPSVLGFHPDGDAIAAANGAADVTVWRLGQLESSSQSLKGQNGFVHSLAYSPDGRRLAVGTGQGPVMIWTPDGNTEGSRLLPSESLVVQAVAVTPAGDRLAAAGCAATQLRDLGDMGLECDQGSVSVWQENGQGGYQQEVLDSVHTDFVKALAWSPDGRFLASGGQDGLVVLWDMEEGTHQQLETLSDDAGRIASEGVMSLAYNWRGDELGIARFDEKISIWDIERERERVLKDMKRGVAGERSEPATVVAFSRDGDTLVAGSDSGAVDLWDISSGGKKSLRAGSRFNVSSSVSTLVVDPATRRLYVADASGRIEVWDMVDTDRVRTFEAPNFSGAMAVSRDGAMLAIGASRGIDLLESTGGRRLGARPLADGLSIRSVGFGGTSDSSVLLASTAADQLFLWRLGPEDLVDQACAIANRRMTEAEWVSYVGSGRVQDGCPH
jgi:WD40 repeat protein